MTNNELLHASLLDILFDGRNKEYGAYALRRNYNQRLLIAMGIGLSVILLFMVLKGVMKNQSGLAFQPDKKEVIITSVIFPDDVPEKLPDLPKPKPVQPEIPKQAEATVINTTIAIVDDYLANSKMPTVDDFENKTSGLENTNGDIGDKVVTPTPVEPQGNGSGENMVVEDVPMKPSSAPEFPGGIEALKKFLSRNLTASDELGLEAGERRMVKARFIVGKDGFVSVIEIIETAGSLFDKEVVRVCKKMPKWKPAIQNGEPVTATYVLPVTFVGE